MHFTLDTEEGLIYIKIREAKVHRTIEIDPEYEVLVDLDKKNRIIGVEFLNPTNIKMKNLEVLAERFNIPQLKIFSPQALRELAAAN